MQVGQGNWRGCARRRVGGSTLVIICWRRIRRHSRLWRCQLEESEHISITKGAAHALEVRSAMVEYGLTYKVVCETSASAGRPMAPRSGVGRVRHLDARLLWLQQLCAEGVVEMLASTTVQTWEQRWSTQKRMTSLLRGTPLRPPVGWSSRMVAATLPAVAEAAKYCRVLIWNVRIMCETSGWFWICVGMVIVILTVLSGGPFANPISQMTVVGRRRLTRMLRNYVQ